MSLPPNSAGELDRIIHLSNFDLDYVGHEDTLKDLVKLAAKVAGTPMSEINIIDFYSQWTISNYGSHNHHTPREDSVCQYTIGIDNYFEVQDLAADERFKDKSYVTGDPHFRYYYGVPLQTSEGHRIGSICVLDTKTKQLNPEKSELLKIIADEIMNRLNALKVIGNLKNEVVNSKETHKRVAHDIRGPIAGIIGLAELIIEQGEENQIDEVLGFLKMIHQSSRSLLELADEILSADDSKKLKPDQLNLLLFRDKLEQLYKPQAVNKNIDFKVNISGSSADYPFVKTKLLQITGNLISNAMKFTPSGGSVHVDLKLTVEDDQNILNISVKDTGVGLDDSSIATILNSGAYSTAGTHGELGYGFGLPLVKHLVDSLHGEMSIQSAPGSGSSFYIKLVQPVSTNHTLLNPAGTIQQS